MKSWTGFFLNIAIAFLVLTIPAIAADWGVVRQADRNLNVRKGRTPKAEHVVTLKKGERVRTDFLKNGWVAVFRMNQAERKESAALGYANVKYLKPVKMTKPAVTPKAKPAAKVAKKPVAKQAPAQKQQNTPANQKKQVVMKPGKPASGAGQVKAPVDTVPPANDEAVSTPSGVPVSITAERMTYDENRKVVAFVGNVIAKHEGLTLWADNISAYLSSKDGKKFQVDSIDRIVARGNVRAKKGKTSGSCGKLTYDVGKRILYMEEKPVLKDGPNSITGEVIRYYVRENRSEVVGDKGKRVEAIFFAPKGLKVQ
jgi:lipopolysaccharide export system protein LptA